MKVIFKYSSPESSSVTTFFFDPQKPLDFLAGQYVEVTLDHENPDNRGIKRTFSISSSPKDKYISITTKTMVEKPSSFTKSLLQLKYGDLVDISSPKGSFTLPQDETIPLLFIAGGIGITTFHSMLTWLKQTGDKRTVHLIYAVSTEEDIIFKNMIGDFCSKTEIMVQKPNAHWGGSSGSLSSEFLLNHSWLTPNTTTYISGPIEMVNTLVKGLELRGIEKSQIVTDAYTGI